MQNVQLRQFEIGRNIYRTTLDPLSYELMTRSSIPEYSITNYDHTLHRSLEKIYSDRRSSSSSSKTKKFCRDTQYNNDWKSIIQPILDQEPSLSKHFSKEELGKLPLLWIAILGCYEKSAELLVRSGADVNEPFGRRDPQVIDEKWTVLHVLLLMRSFPGNNERLIHLVTERSNNLLARDYTGKTVLHLAVQTDRVKVTEMLLKKGVEVNAIDDYGMTPLLDAVTYSSKAHELVPLLVKYGADVFATRCDFPNDINQNVYHHLACNYRLGHNVDDVVKFFIEKGLSPDEKQNVHFHPIHIATSTENLDLMKCYLDNGINVNARAANGDTPLHMAIQSSTDIEVKMLLKRGANVHLRNKEGGTVLHAACFSAALIRNAGNLVSQSIIRMLLDAGADVLDDKGYFGKTPLALISSRPAGKEPGKEAFPLIEVLAMKKALKPSIELKDQKIIEQYPMIRDYYRKCTDEMDRMKLTKFTWCCTLIEFFSKRRCKIATLMRDPEFETKFKLYDLNNEFPIYAEEIRRAFERAKKVNQTMLENENFINETVYNKLSYVIVRKMVHYMSNCCGKSNS